MDVFFFRDDSLQLLDAYQRFDTLSPLPLPSFSSAAARRIVVVCGGPEDRYAWSGITSYAGLLQTFWSMEDERPEAPRMVGEMPLASGVAREVTVPLHPALCRVCIASVSCDFSDRSYRGASLGDVRVYLTHVSRQCPVLRPDATPISWFNSGYWDAATLSVLARPDAVYWVPETPFGPERQFPDRSFYCYPNPTCEEGLGRPLTKLVIEGSLAGRTCYYPIPLPGLRSGEERRLHITLTRAGTSDPDLPALPGSLQVQEELLPWDWREETTIHF